MGSRKEPNPSFESASPTLDKYDCCYFKQRKDILHYKLGQDNFTDFPVLSEETMQQIVDVHYPKLEETLLMNALKTFFGIREVKNIKKTKM